MRNDAHARRPGGPRPAHAAAVASSVAGFTLLESLIALTLGGLVVMGAFSLFTTQQRATTASDIRSEVHQGGRYALDMLNRDLTRAGQGMDPNTGFGVVATVNGTGGDPDTLWTLSGATSAPKHVTKAVTAGFEKDSLNLRISCGDPVDDIEQGVFVYLADGNSRGLAHVLETERETTDLCSGSDPDTKDIGTLHASITVVDGEAHGWPIQENTVDMGAQRVVPRVYFVENTDAAPPQLVRATKYVPESSDWEGPPIAEGVQDFQVRLILSSGDTVDVADPTDGDPDNDYDDVNTVIADLVLEARRTDRNVNQGEPFVREYTVNVTPRNQMYTRNLK